MTIIKKIKSEFEGIIGQDLISAPFTTIENRAKINRSFQPVFGNERVTVNSISKVINEFGPEGQPVFESDKKDSRIRFIGGWHTVFSSNGMYTSTTGDATGSSFEVSFYGNYLNIMSYIDTNDRSLFVSVDGNAGTSIPFTSSSVLTIRNYKMNVVTSVAKDLPDGWHTALVTSNNISPVIFGFEFGSTNSNIQILEGKAFANGMEYSSDAITSIPYNTGFENVLDINVGTKGGKAIVYVDSVDNLIKKKLNVVDTTSKF